MAKGIGYLHTLGTGLLKSATWEAGAEAESLTGPYLIHADDLTNGWSEWSDPWNPRPGPFVYGSALYWVVIDYARYYYPPKILKSTDHGATWNFLCNFGSGEAPEQWFYVPILMGATGHVCIIQGGNDDGRYIELRDFNMADESVTLLSTSPTPLGNDEFVLAGHYNHITEEVYIFTRYIPIGQPPPIDQTRVYVYGGGSWSSAQSIVTEPFTSTNWGIRSATGNDGVTHLFLNEGISGAGSDSHLYYVQLAADGTLGSPELIYDQTTDAPPSLDCWRMNAASIINDSIVIPFTNTYGAVFIIGTGLSSPSFSIEQYSANSQECAVSTNNANNLPGTDGRIWWIEYAQPSMDWGKLVSCTFDGTTKGAEETVHDEQVDPSFPGVDQWMYYLTPPINVHGNTWGFATVLSDGVNYDTHYYWEWTKGGPAAIKGVARIS